MSAEPDELDEESGEDEEKPTLPGWLDGVKVFTKYKVNAPQLRELVKLKKVRVRLVNGRQCYAIDDLERLTGSESDGSGGPQADLTGADLVRAAASLLAQVEKNEQTKFDNWNKAFQSILDHHETYTNKQAEHILALEKQALEMREATEKVFTLEHERKLSELKEERTREIQKRALETLQKTLAPWIAAKLGGVKMPGLGGVAEAAGGQPDPRFAQLGEHVVSMVVRMTDTQFEELGKIVPPEEYAVLAAIRDGMKGEAS